MSQDFRFVPGYSGFVPTWIDPRETLKTGPNTHVDARDRNIAAQSTYSANSVPHAKSHPADGVCTRPISVAGVVGSASAFGAATGSTYQSTVGISGQMKPTYEMKRVTKRRPVADETSPEMSGRSVAGLPPASEVEQEALREAQKGLLKTTYKTTFDKFHSCPKPERVRMSQGVACKFEHNPTETTSHKSDFLHPQETFGGTITSMKDLSQSATINCLLSGTTRSTGHVSGYTGHVPTHPENVAQMNGETDNGRMHAKDDTAMNYRFAKTGYGGHRPKSFVNQAHALASSGGTNQNAEDGSGNVLLKSTMNMSFGNNHRIARPETFEGEVHPRKAAVVSFFNGGSRVDAETFYGRFRPLEGRPRLR